MRAFTVFAIVCCAFCLLSPDGQGRASAAAPPAYDLPRASIGSAAFVGDGVVRDVAWTADGERLASAAYDGVRVWDRRTGQCLRVFPGHDADSLDVSSDGKQIVTGNWDGEVWLLSLTDGKRRRLFAEDKKEINGVAFSPVKNQLAWTAGKTVRLYDFRTAKLLHSFEAGEKVHHLKFTPDGKHLVAEGERDRLEWFDVEGKVRLAPTLAPEPAEKRDTPPLPPAGARWNPERGAKSLSLFWTNGALWSVGSDRTLKECLSKAGGPLILTDHDNGRHYRLDARAKDAGLVVSPDGRWMALVGRGSAIRVWDLRGGRQLFRGGCNIGPIVSVHFDTPTSVAATDETGSLHAWSLPTKAAPAVRHLQNFGIGAHQPRFVVMPGGGGRIATVGGWITVRDVRSGAILAYVEDPGHVEGVMLQVGLAGDKEFGATYSPEMDSGHVLLFDRKTGKPTKKVEIPHYLRGEAAFSPAGGYFAFDVPFEMTGVKAVDDLDTGKTKFLPVKSPKGLFVYDLKTGRQRHVILDPKRGMADLAFSPDESFLVGAGKCGHLWVWDVRTGKLAARYRARSIKADRVAVAPDGKAIACADGPRVTLYEFPALTRRRILRHNQRAVTALSFSDDSRLLVTGGADTTIKVWDVSSVQ